MTDLFIDYKGKARTPKNDQERRMAAQQAQARKALNEGCCPKCGRPVKLNLAMRGWVVCTQKGAVGFRADAQAPACGWDGFTG